MTTVSSSRDAVDVVEIEPHQNFPGSNTLFSEKVVFNDDINYVRKCQKVNVNKYKPNVDKSDYKT